MNKNYPILAREGWPFITLTIMFFVISIYFINPVISGLSGMICLFVIQFFRDPQRKIVAKPNEVVSAADGRVIAIEKTNDPYNKREAIKISVFMNVFNVHSNKVPISGKVINKIYKPGKFLNAALEKASSENEHCAITIKTSNNQIVTSVQIAGLIARRILCYANAGSELEKGDRYGFHSFWL